jgi:hypothetical protein
MALPIRPVEERFWKRVNKHTANGCWEWTGPTIKTGYGTIAIRGSGRRDYTNTLVHRLSWKIAFGEIPSGMLVCHKCDNRTCCNPAHLFLGTQFDNMQDCASKGRHGSKPKSHCGKGHPFSEENTYLFQSNGKTYRHCKTCTKERSHQWFINNRDKHRETSRDSMRRYYAKQRAQHPS